MSVPFVPPAKTYTPLEKLVEMVPNWGYHLFFADQNSSREIESKVGIRTVDMRAVR